MSQSGKEIRYTLEFDDLAKKLTLLLCFTVSSDSTLKLTIKDCIIVSFADLEHKLYRADVYLRLFQNDLLINK